MVKFGVTLVAACSFLLKVGEAHRLIFEARYENSAPEVSGMMDKLLQIRDINNARLLVRTATYCKAAGYDPVDSYDLKATIDGLVDTSNEPQYGSTSIKVRGLSDAEILRAMRHLGIINGELVCLEDQKKRSLSRL